LFERNLLNMNEKRPLQNSTAVLVLGILSIVLTCFFVGLILGIIGLVLSKDDRKRYAENPDLYLGYQNLNAGFIMSIIGTSLGVAYSIFAILKA